MTNKDFISGGKNKKIIEEAAKKAGVSADKIQRAAESGDFSDVISNLNPSVAQKINKVLSDQESMNKILESEQVQSFIKKFNEGKK